MLDFRNQIEKNKQYYETLWDYCTCIGVNPSDIHYPGMKSHVLRNTFNLFVYEVGRPAQIKRENELAQASGIGSIMK